MGVAGGEGVLSDYDPDGYFCEMLGRADAPSAHTEAIRERLAGQGLPELRRRARAAERELFTLGIPFPIYSARHAIASVSTSACGPGTVLCMRATRWGVSGCGPLNLTPSSISLASVAASSVMRSRARAGSSVTPMVAASAVMSAR